MITVITMKYSYWVAESGYDAVGYFNDGKGSVYGCTNFSSSTLQLLNPVSVGKYQGKSLIQALNARADFNLTAKYSRWVLNKDNNAVTFAVNGVVPYFKMDSQLILTPSLADGVSKKFDGWYTDNTYTTKLTDFELSGDTNLYGKFA